WMNCYSMSGTIPASIAHLTALTSLVLYQSGLSGSIPEAISSLKQLQRLGLSQNNLSGSIPEAISSLKQLQDLDLRSNTLSGTIPSCIGHLTALTYFSLDHNQLTGELPSFHHMARLTSQQGLSADHNYLTATADPLLFNATSLEDSAESLSLCLFHHNCLDNNSISCGRWQDQRRDSECRAFCGVQQLTPPCSGHGVCSFMPDPSEETSACEEDVPPPPYCEPDGYCVCDEGYTPGPAAGTCVPHGIPSEPPGIAVVGVALSALQKPRNLLLLLLPLAVLLLLAFSLPLFLRPLKNRPPTRYFFSKRALAARQAGMGVEINC
ncbi:unnamed protein product, partial [Closterium sp. Yama58-4]